MRCTGTKRHFADYPEATKREAAKHHCRREWKDATSVFCSPVLHSKSPGLLQKAAIQKARFREDQLTAPSIPAISLVFCIVKCWHVKQVANFALSQGYIRMIPTPQPLSFRQKITVLLNQLPTLAPWPVGCAILIAGVWAWATATIRHEQNAILERSRISVEAQARTYAEQIDRTIGQIDYIMRSLQFHWLKTGGALDLEEQVKAGLVPLDVHMSVTIFSESGSPVTSTSPDIKRTAGIGSRAYFRAHAANPSRELMISKPMKSILTARDIIILSRRLERENGAFAGVMAAAIEPIYLASFVDATKIGKDGFFSVRATDGTFVAAKTRTGFRSQGPVFQNSAPIAERSGVAVRSADRYLDRKSRLVAWDTVPHYPLVAIVGVSSTTLMEEYEPRYREIQMGAMMASLVVLLIAASGMRRSILRVWAVHSAREVHEAYRIATENATDGFYMLRALYGRNHEIVDFLIEDCNERGAQYRGLPRSSMLGKTLSATMPILFESHMLPACRHAMDTGFFEDEMKIPQHGARAVQWLQRRLVRTSAGLAVTLRDITESKLHQETLEQMANADALTSLPNRHWLMNYLPEAIERARNNGNLLAVMFVDLDDFKNINDTLGHAAGDELLQAMASRLKAAIRPEDKVARLGGDEFTILVEAAQTREEVAAVAERLIDTLHDPFVFNDIERQHCVHASIGISLFPLDGANGQTLLKHADIAMYAAKMHQKGTYRFFEPSLERRLVTRLNREAELKIAIERKQLVLHYQPRVSGDTGEITSMEALIRWAHPTQGLLPPNDFIPLAEKTGLIVPLGAEVIRLACEQLAHWEKQGLNVVPISINVSAQQIDAGMVGSVISRELNANGLETRLLEVELTESATVTESGSGKDELAELQKAGVRLYVDDFGTGYSCLAQLKRLDMDGLKIDRAFTAQLLNGPADAALFEAIVSMAHALDMHVVAEGVETGEQLVALQRLSCEEVQGYFISKPMPPTEAALLLQRRFLFPAV
jgi:diguanylate cyclase (GGDEF)-like protein